MTTKRLLCGVTAGAALIAGIACSPGTPPMGPEPVEPKNVTWDVTNSVGSAISLKFFDRTTGAVWPGSTTYWALDAGERQTYKLSCNKDSQICFGAALSKNRNYYWGVGLDNRSGCQGCCHVCGSGDPTPLSLRSQ